MENKNAKILDHSGYVIGTLEPPQIFSPGLNPQGSLFRPARSPAILNSSRISTWNGGWNWIQGPTLEPNRRKGSKRGVPPAIRILLKTHTGTRFLSSGRIIITRFSTKLNHNFFVNE